LPKSAILILTAYCLGILAVVVGAVYGLAILVEGLTLSVTLNPLSVRIALSCVFVAVAVFSYLIKKSRGQFVYGMLEVAIGLVANWQSLDTWFHPEGGPGTANVIYSRFVVLTAGTYAIGRGISNVADGFERFFPNLWPKVRAELAPLKLYETYMKAYYKPMLDVPTAKLKFHICTVQDRIAALEKKQGAAVKAGRDPKAIQWKIGLLNEELKIVTERYEKEVLGHSRSDSQED
jgi:hypothetical protein